jgi:tetratricopeptide (TPR) repeat protein
VIERTNMDRASRELRRILVAGRLDGAVEAFERLQASEAVDATSARQALRWIVDGIQQVLNNDTPRGIEHLEQAAAVTSTDDSLRWVALHWMAKGSAAQGQLDRAERAAAEGMSVAARLGPQARSLSLLTRAEISALLGKEDETLDHLRSAIQVLKDVDDDRGAATALLAMARTLIRLGRIEDGEGAADNAREADPTWPDSAVFLSERALAAGDVERAIRHIAPFLEQTPSPPAAERQRSLIEGVRAKCYDARAVDALLRLRDRPLTAEAVSEMEVLLRRLPAFHQLRELIGWSLYKLGRVEEAEAHFNTMTALKLDSQLRASVSLGLGCIASRRHSHPAARVKAASGSFPMVKPIALAAAVEEAPVAVPSDPPPQAEPTWDDRKTQRLPVEPRAPAVRRDNLTPEPTFVGDLQLFAVPDLLDFLQSSRRTGTLVVTSERGTAAVHLIDGRITGAAAPGSANLGDLLIERGALTREGLSTALRRQLEASSQLLLGSVLMDLKLVDRDSLERTLVDQVKMALLEMVGWQEGRFAFEPFRGSAEHLPDEVVVDLDTRAVLMDVLRQYDEMCK